ncbi:uncharacterized protein LOC132946779 [Metopolophium dirhodum]|uniref:uncharacterized protein LOC132946779 n=1 Tax=Metopolophium dirhodum TaxID=44670 RepID=UPI00298FBB64|nr:uncharacterized protein LOC132946779 [Metopolophium dirhodum]
MDEFTVGVLIEWGFEELIDTFKDEEIGKDDFLSLTELMVKELIPKMGKRSSFYSKLTRLKEIQESIKYTEASIPIEISPLVLEDQISEHVDKINISDITNFELHDVEGVKNNIDLFSDENVFGNTSLLESYDNTKISLFIGGSYQDPGKNLTNHIGTSNNDCHQSLSTDEIVEANKAKDYISKILNKYSDGKVVLNYYESVGTLNQFIRNSLSSIIIKHEIQQSIKIEKNKFTLLAKGIEQLFLSETGQTYFTPYFKDGNNVHPMRGKLYDKYCNLRKQIKQINPSKVIVTTQSTENDILIDDECKEKILWLKNNTQPTLTLHKYWTETSNYRLTIKENCIELYPAFKSPTGHLLIEIDFQTLYPGKDKLLFHKFDVFKVKLIKYIDKLNKRFSLQDESTLLSELKTPSRPGNDNISVLKLLPQLFQPLTIKLDKKRKRDGKHSIWRPSKAEQADSFVLFIPDVSELRNVHAQKIEKAVQYGTTLQPYIIIVDNTDIYAVINSIYYKLETPLKALDVCYKSYFALNLNYPQESEQIWLFIQNYFFDTTLKSDKHVLFVKTFINDLKNM